MQCFDKTAKAYTIFLLLFILSSLVMKNQVYKPQAQRNGTVLKVSGAGMAVGTTGSAISGLVVVFGTAYGAWMHK